jgi:heat shock protein HtpX
MAFSSVGTQTHIWNNNIKSAILLLGFPLLLLSFIWAFLWFAASIPIFHNPDHSPMEISLQMMQQIWPYVLSFMLCWFVVAWLWQKNIVSYMTGAHPVTRAQAPLLYNLTENLCISRGMQMPQLYLIDSPALNAYAFGTGQQSQHIAVTQGLLTNLSKDELESVLAHELTHIFHRDSRFTSISLVFIGLFGMLIVLLRNIHDRFSIMKTPIPHFVILYALALPIRLGMQGLLTIANWLAKTLSAALSRRREYNADAGAVMLTQNADALIRALTKIAQNPFVATASPHFSAMFIQPLTHYNDYWHHTHPPLAKRIAILQRIS